MFSLLFWGVLASEGLIMQQGDDDDDEDECLLPNKG